MGKHWTEVKKEIEAEIDKCWYNRLRPAALVFSSARPVLVILILGICTTAFRTRCRWVCC